MQGFTPFSSLTVVFFPNRRQNYYFFFGYANKSVILLKKICICRFLFVILHAFRANKAMIKKLLLALTVITSGLVLLLLGTAVSALYVPALRNMALDKGLEVARKQTGLDIDMGQIYLSPFYHSPMVIYRAYKGEADLPLVIAIDSLFVGHRGQDTLIYVHALRLDATLQTTQLPNGITNVDDLLATPITVNRLYLDKTTLHSDSLIAAIGIDAGIGLLDVSSPQMVIAEGKYPLHGLRLNDADIGIELRETPPDTTTQDTTPLQMAFEVPDGVLRNICFRLQPMDMEIRTGHLATNVLVDVGNNRYDAKRLEVEQFVFGLGTLSIPVDTIHGNAFVDLNRNIITSSGLSVRSSELGASADLRMTEMDLETMRVTTIADANYQGSKVRLRAMYDIDDEVYDAHVEIEQVNLAPFLKDSTPVVLAGEIDAQGKGIDPHSRAMRSIVSLHLTEAIYDNINASGLQLDAELADGAVDGKLHLPIQFRDDSLVFRGRTEHQFHVVDFMDVDKLGVDYRAQMQNVEAHVAGEDFQTKQLDLHFTTDSTTTLYLATEGLSADVKSPMHVMKLVDQLSALGNDLSTFTFQLSDLSSLDTLREKIPALDAKFTLRHGSPAQGMIDKTGLDVESIDLTLHSNSSQTELALDAVIPEIAHPEDSTALRLPPAAAALRVTMLEDSTHASFNAHTKLTDGAMTLHDLQTDAYLWFDVERKGNDLNGVGRLTMDNISFGDNNLGNSAINMALSRSETYSDALRADVSLDDVPLEIAKKFIQM